MSEEMLTLTVYFVSTVCVMLVAAAAALLLLVPLPPSLHFPKEERQPAESSASPDCRSYVEKLDSPVAVSSPTPVQFYSR